MSRTLNLLLDIDDTVVRCRPEIDTPPTLFDQELLLLIRDYTVREQQQPSEHVEAIIRTVHEQSPWWDWHDYLEALDIDPQAIWPELDQTVSRWIQPQDEHLQSRLDRVIDQGHRLFVTSNNPTSGIAHKLRIAGLDDDWQQRRLTHCFGTDRLEAMKDDVRYWQRVLDRIDTDIENFVVIGNNPHDDFAMPAAAGIQRFVIVQPYGSETVAQLTSEIETPVHAIEVPNLTPLPEVIAKHHRSYAA